jgi:acyl-coenzyme A thioesterase PaaI-like protein
MKLRTDLRTAGGLLAAPLGIALLDTAGINVDAIGRCAPTQIDVTVFDPAVDVAEVRTFGEIIREGRTQMFTQGRFEDATRPGRVIGFGTTSWAVMAPTPPGFAYVDPGPGIPDAPDLPAFVEAFGVTPHALGGYELAGLSPQVGADSLHQGPIQAMLEAAALDAARETARTDVIYAEHTGTTIVRRGKTGPFVATASVLAAGNQTVACRAELRDHGEGGRVVATGFSLYRRAAS